MMMQFFRTLTSLGIFLVLLGCSQQFNSLEEPDDLFENFQNPPAEARPFVRWWWNGNHITADEIKRQLDVLSVAGLGGVEINPIAMPEEAADVGTQPVEWLSKEWNQLLALASQEAKQRGMITDLIVGSGWPFGGEFITKNETAQRVIIHEIPVSGGTRIQEEEESLVQKAIQAQIRQEEHEAQSNEFLFVSLIPEGLTEASKVIDLSGNFKGSRLIYEVPEGNYKIVYGVLQKGHREVMHGALGAAGPVMDHYDREVTLAYLNRLKKISEDTGIALDELLRALFCDSIEIAGANWTEGFEDFFYDTYQYRLEPYYSFVFYEPFNGYPTEDFSVEFTDELKRVRYDYNKLLVKVFLDNFTRTFQEFCTENGLKSRYQAYGIPFLMGMMEGNMIADIPESNNWIYSVNMDAEQWEWNHQHGYMIWNLYAASGGHLTGKNIISTEAMTNTKGVFKTSLEEIKQHDDMNFITGMNHTILHGYNYSPEEAGFPGWIRYGSYFSEQNTWWPYFSKWVDYNARLSYVFQNSRPVKSIAILGPVGDIWSTSGLTRIQFHTEPWYLHRLWEPLSQIGSSSEYIGENIIAEGDVTGGTLKYVPMIYQAIFVSGVESLRPETAQALCKFVDQGGKLVLIDEVPSRSLSYQDAASGDAMVQKAFAEMQEKYPEQVFVVRSPATEDELLNWTRSVLDRAAIDKDLQIRNPYNYVYQIHKQSGEKDIYFFVNSNREKTVNLEVTISVKKKTAWRWNPEDGTRGTVPFNTSTGEMTLSLQPLESYLLVFEPGNADSSEPKEKRNPGKVSAAIEGPWQVRFDHVNGESFSRNFDELKEFGTSSDPQLSTFAGTVTYTTTFTADGDEGWLALAQVNRGVTEVFVNGKQVGVNWYGKSIFPLNNIARGENKLEIKYTTVLSNYSRSLQDNPTAVRWTKGFEAIPVGLEGKLTIYKN
jgi:hypothetical protein